MQTIELEFKKLDKLPVPESSHEFIFGKSPYGVIRCFSPVFKKGIPTFDFKLEDDDWTYAHIQVTAKPETAFKVGDRVLYKNYEMVICYIHQKESSCILFNSSFTGIVEEVPLTDLTLITE